MANQRSSRKASGKRTFPAHLSRHYLVPLLLVLLTFLVFARVAGYQFINYDDDQYVYDNPHVRSGLTWGGIAWAFTSFYAANWHPATWASHMVDVQFFGLDAGRHHCVNLMLHCVNVVLLLLVLFRMTGALWRSAFVAALFALHPLHVESVAWIAERKDVLSTFFLFLTIAAYIQYSKKPCFARYVPVFTLFALGLMSKPMLVTLPFVLLLLDLWPLERTTRLDWSILRLIQEKVPLIAMSLASGIITLLAQAGGEAIVAIPFPARVANACVSYVSYLVKALCPQSLAVFYPHPWLTHGGYALWQVSAAAVLIAAISFAVLRQLHRRKYLAVGWLWYTIMLIPVIGVVQVGGQAIADRYTYVPLVGIFVIAAWGGNEVLARFHVPGKVTAALASATLAVLSLSTWFQVAHWQNSTALFSHALRITQANWVPNYNLGLALEDEGKIDLSIHYYREALRYAPTSVKVHNNLGHALIAQGNFDEAITQFHEALRLDAKRAEVHANLAEALAAKGKFTEAAGECGRALQLNPNCSGVYPILGNLYLQKGQFENAVASYRSALRIEPDSAAVRNNLGNALAAQGNLSEAVGQFAEAVRLEPNRAGFHQNLGKALAAEGRAPEAIQRFKEAIRLDPSLAEAHCGLGDLFTRTGNPADAVVQFRLSLSIEPNDAPAHFGLANALFASGRMDEAIAGYRRTLQLSPGNAEVYCNLGLALAKQGKMEEAVADFREALRLKPNFAEARQFLELALGKD